VPLGGVGPERPPPSLTPDAQPLAVARAGFGASKVSTRFSLFSRGSAEAEPGPLSPAEVPLKQLMELLDAPDGEGEGDDFVAAVSSAKEGVGRVLKEGREGPGLPNHVGQLAFELTRYISLLDMDVRLLNASREEATRRLRLQQAQSRCRQSLQICETAHKLAAGEG